VLNISVTVLSGPSSGDEFKMQLKPDVPINIGRAKNNDLVLYDPLVSRFHAALELREGAPYLLDLGSTQGTYLMGFQVRDRGERLNPGDEFKVGSALLRANTIQAVQTEEEKSAELDAAAAAKRGKFKVIAIAVLSIVLAAILVPELMPHRGAPSQSEERLPGNYSDAVGYYPGLGSSSSKNHPYGARFNLPLSDQVVEFEFRGKVPVSVFSNGKPIARLTADDTAWNKWELVIPDYADVPSRELVLRPIGIRKGGVPQHWAVRNMRSTPLGDVPIVSQDLSFDFQLASTRALVDILSTDSTTLFKLVRGLQTLLTMTLVGGGIDGAGFRVQLDQPLLSANDLRKRLDGLKDEKAEQPRQRDLVSLLSATEAELWRRFGSRLSAASIAVDSKDWGQALREFEVLKRSFPDPADYRHDAAQDILRKKLPKRVLANPENYLKKGSK
jgi:hypothetical protein